MITQLLERGSLLRHLVEDLGQGVRAVFGSLANLAVQLREALKYCLWPEDCFDPRTASGRRIGLDTS
jgi:hypothetical protein